MELAAGRADVVYIVIECQRKSINFLGPSSFDIVKGKEVSLRRVRWPLFKAYVLLNKARRARDLVAVKGSK